MESLVDELMSRACHMQFSWKTMLEIANKKARVEKDMLIYRLAFFPLPWLDRICMNGKTASIVNKPPTARGLQPGAHIGLGPAPWGGAAFAGKLLL